jgi:hypothetical protein
VREAADEPLVLQLGNDLLQRRHFKLGGLGLVSLYSRRGVQSPKNEALDSDSLPREGTSFKQKLPSLKVENTQKNGCGKNQEGGILLARLRQLRRSG